MSHFVWKLAEIMLAKGITITQLAARTGLNYKTIADMQKGRYERVGLPTLARLCDALDVELSDLLERKEDQAAG